MVNRGLRFPGAKACRLNGDPRRAYMMTRFLVVGRDMVTVSLAQAKARLSELLDKVEAGEEILVTRHRRAVARIIAAERPKTPIDFERLAEFRATIPSLGQPSVELLRAIRDEEP
jgi:prevent-host-death family protein